MDIVHLNLVNELIRRREELIGNLPRFDSITVTDRSEKFGLYGSNINPGDDEYETIKAILIKRFKKEWNDNTTQLASLGVTNLDAVSLPF